ncbi:WXG100 family type VII secretion target [Serinibacter salmoneus]|uniref:WXG100 family type VII secretion target n=1 Tax=Serinibacter salmoneus TaxID=556530 RepID=A0A2A9D5P7_9MICO|nr:WXG100 family type VII secretion target [Serinibacter salmoneus]PFG21282.1 WXG100 family type VII secretion target [Serinibacter salmoneus]
MATGFVSRDNAITASVGILQDGKTQLTQAIASMNAQLDSLGGAWLGAGASAFHQVRSRWTGSTTTLLSSLDEFGQILQSSQAAYVAQDVETTDAMSHLAARLS